MNNEILENCVTGSFAGTMTFGEIVGHMIKEDVEWYSANLLFGMSTHYAHDGSHHQSRWPGWEVPEIADLFDEAGVVAAIRASQAGQIKYPEFLQRVARRGVVYYTVHMRGRKAIYFGRHGDFHVELFPR